MESQQKSFVNRPPSLGQQVLPPPESGTSSWKQDSAKNELDKQRNSGAITGRGKGEGFAPVPSLKHPPLLQKKKTF